MNEKEFFDEMDKRTQMSNRYMSIFALISLVLAVIASIVYALDVKNSMWKSYPEEIYKQLELMTANEGDKVDNVFALVECLETKSGLVIKEFIYEGNDFKISYYSAECKEYMQNVPTITITLSKKGEVLLKVRNYYSQQEYLKSVKKQKCRNIVFVGLGDFTINILISYFTSALIVEKKFSKKIKRTKK